MAGAFIIDFGNTNSKTKTITLIETSETYLCGNILDSVSLKVTDICTAHKNVSAWLGFACRFQMVS